MFYKNQVTDEKALCLLNALSEYQTDLERGNYDTLDAYATNYSAEEVWPVISDNLSGASEKLSLSAQEFASFESQLKEESPTRFALIAQFIASLYLLMTQQQVKPEDELANLKKDSKTILHIEAGMPGLCLAHLSAVEHSLLNTKSKLSALSQILISLEKNKEQFGVLSDLIIQVSVQHWLELFEQLDPGLQANFLSSKGKHQERAAHCLSIEEAQGKLTIIEKYTLKILEKLSNGIGKITIPKSNAKDMVESKAKAQEKSQQSFFNNTPSTSETASELNEQGTTVAVNLNVSDCI